MSFLQRPPIDVHASIGCARAPRRLRETTTKILNASEGLRPYSAGIVRACLTKTNIRDMQQQDPSALAVLSPIDEVVEHWWERNGQEGFTPTQLDYDLMIHRSHSGIHTDQLWDQQSGRPFIGPITAIAVLEGSVQYAFAVHRYNAFNGESEGTEPKPRHSLFANSGDVVMFTNLPPTYHMANTLSETSLRAVFIGRLETESLE